MTHSRRDNNEREIIDFLKSRAGCWWIPQDRYAGFDGLLLCIHGIFVVEVKHPETRNHLTFSEARLRDVMSSLLLEYHVITSIEEAAELIGLRIEA